MLKMMEEDEFIRALNDGSVEDPFPQEASDAEVEARLIVRHPELTTEVTLPDECDGPVRRLAEQWGFSPCEALCHLIRSASKPDENSTHYRAMDIERTYPHFPRRSDKK
jgi:hypothetical protein